MEKLRIKKAVDLYQRLKSGNTEFGEVEDIQSGITLFVDDREAVPLWDPDKGVSMQNGSMYIVDELHGKIRVRRLFPETGTYEEIAYTDN